MKKEKGNVDNKRKESPNKSKQNNNLRLHYKKDSFQFPQTTTHRKNNFLSTGYIQNVNTVRAKNLSNLNQNQSNQINIAGIDFMKANKKKNQLKYSNIPLKNENKINNFLHSTSTQEINKGLKRGSKQFLNINYQQKNHHTKSLSYNFDMQIPSIRPKSTKRFMNYNKDKKGNLKDLRFELNEILKKGISKSSRPNDLKGGYKYNLNPMSVSTGFNIKYTNKLLKEKFSNKI